MIWQAIHSGDGCKDERSPREGIGATCTKEHFRNSRVSALPAWRLKRIEAHVDQHLARAVPLSELAAVAGLSRMHFAAQFRIATGSRPRAYVLRQRIERAKGILTTSETPLAEVALIVGFQGQSHFTTAFKRITGVTPAVWRRMSHEPGGMKAIDDR